MKKILSILLAAALCLGLSVGAFASGEASGGPTGGEQKAVSVVEASDEMLGSFMSVTLTGLTPFVFVPTGAGSENAEDFQSVTAMTETYGEREKLVAAISGGIFYNTGQETQYCFHYKEPDGVVIADGVVLKSTESIDHSECDILVIDENGNVGWADYYADADALAAGEGVYYDIHGEEVYGAHVVSAVTGFVPIVVGGKSVYDETDDVLNGYDNFVGHYTQRAVRQVFGVREDGAYVILTNTTGWTLADAAVAALINGCVFAYNLDGGGSAETVVALYEDDAYTIKTIHGQTRGERTMPTYIVFTADNEAPVSAVPLYITAVSGGDLPAGASLADIAASLTVTEYLCGANGQTSRRALYSAQALEDGKLIHTVIGGSGEMSETEVKTSTVSPNGTLYHVKTEDETALSLLLNSNTRADGAYYDYSTGYTVAVWDDLTTPGEKLVLVSYVPGAGYGPLLAFATVTLN